MATSVRTGGGWLVAVLLVLAFPSNIAVAQADPPALQTGCPAIRLADGFSPARRTAATEALADACSIIRSEPFRTAVLARTDWFAGCRGGFGRPISAAAVLDVYPRDIRALELRAENVGGVALSDLPHGWTRIDVDRFDRWIAGDRLHRAALINTLVHEMTHHVPTAPGGSRYAFTDRGNNRLACPKDRLVSYGLGRIAADLWLKAHPAP